MQKLGTQFSTPSISTTPSTSPVVQKKDIVQYGDTVTTLVNQYIVSPVLNLGLGGFVFSNAGSTEVNMTAEITDHFVENNSAIQDHIALKPERITLRGYVREIVYSSPSNSQSVLKNPAKKITTINSFIPIFTKGVKQSYNSFTAPKSGVGDYVASYSDGGINLYKTFKQINPPRTEQAKAFNYFRALFYGKQILSLETPWSFYTDMAIESVTAEQDDESKYITNFSVTLKKIQFCSTQYVQFDSNIFSDMKSQAQHSDVENNVKAQGGKAKGLDISLLASGTNVFKSMFGKVI